MKSRTTLIGQVLLALLAFTLAACERSASTAPQATTDPFPAANTPSMEMVEQMLGTPQVEDAATGDPAAVETPQPGDGTIATLVPLDAVTETTEAPIETTPETVPQDPTPIVVESQPTVATIRPASYTLQKGEFPYCIARRFNVNPADLLALNNLSVAQSNVLQPGLVLQIPASGAFTADRALLPHPAQYTVQQGDTIYSIACKYGDVDPVNIAAVNALSAPYTLTVGTVLQIP